MKTPVITGIGVVSSIGIGKGAFFKSLNEGKCGIGTVTLFDTSIYSGKLGAEVKNFSGVEQALGFFGEIPNLRIDRLSRCDRFGIVALAEAIRDSGIDLKAVPSKRIAVVIGAGSGGLFSAEAFKRQAYEGKKPRPSFLVPFTSSALTDCIALIIGSRGFRATISTACSSSATAIGFAGDIIRKGLADIVIAGGSESLSETTFSGFNSLRAVDELPCRPFDKERKGISLGEGSAIFVIESRENATGRRLYAEVSGYGLSADAYHVTSPAPDGLSIAEAIKTAIRKADLSPDDIDYINAHGTGTIANDLAETNAIKAVFGKKAYKIPISSTKSMIGHCLGAAGALEAVACISALENRIIPPTINYKTPDPECDLDYVPNTARHVDVKAILSNSLAFGGNNTALVLKKP